MLKLQDVKRTVRARSDGERYLHPKLLDGAAPLGQVALALGYFQSRLGRARHELDPEMLVRCFGDPKIARGLVACLGTTYHWRSQDFAEVLDGSTHCWLAARGLYTPTDLRLHLYDLVNMHGDGFLASVRDEHLRPLARRLHLSPAKLDQLIALDAEEHAVLMRVGETPKPEDVLALYNWSAIDAVLRSSQCVELDAPGPAAFADITAACAAYQVRLTHEDGVARLHNQPDAFGSYARWGARLVRALYTAAAAHPTLLRRGRARVCVPGKPAWYLFERATLQALTARTGVVRRGQAIPAFQEAWSRKRGANGTAGWRLIAAPEPRISSAGLAVAPLACRRDEQQVLLWPVEALAALDDALALHAAGVPVLAMFDGTLAGVAPSSLPSVSQADGVTGVVAALDAHWGGPRASVLEQAMASLLSEVDLRGFVPEAQVLTALGCVTASELALQLRTLDPERGAYVPGIGLCSPSFAEGMRKGLRRRPRRSPAA